MFYALKNRKHLKVWHLSFLLKALCITMYVHRVCLGVPLHYYICRRYPEMLSFRVSKAHLAYTDSTFTKVFFIFVIILKYAKYSVGIRNRYAHCLKYENNCVFFCFFLKKCILLLLSTRLLLKTKWKQHLYTYRK